MPRKPKSADGVSKPNPFSSGPTAPPQKQPLQLPNMMPLQSQALAVMSHELTTAKTRVAELERQLADEQAGRRADIERIEAGRRDDLERLLREQSDLRVRIAQLEAQGKPSSDTSAE